MPEAKPTRAEAAGKTRVLNVRPDAPDVRDRYYEPALIPLAKSVRNLDGKVLNQEDEGACTGFALAAVINLLNRRAGDAFHASPRMLFEMARLHDHLPGENYSFSTCRGAIRGWANMGVCAETEWRYEPFNPGELTIKRAISARNHPLGAYYRLRPNVVDYHAALNEVDAIYVSARLHTGWLNPVPRDELALIPQSDIPMMGHAFAIVGYDDDGFIVQNSWGTEWATNGFAVWRYEDWQSSISDGWVFRLGVPTPQIFGQAAHGKRPPAEAEFFKRSPKRHQISGHFAHFDDGRFVTNGKYWTNLDDIRRTAKHIASKQDWYRHVMIFAHGGLNSSADSARRINALKEGFMRNRVYPFHLMYDTGLAEELKDALVRSSDKADEQASGFFDWVVENVTEATDSAIESLIRAPGTAIWEEMKRGGRTPFQTEAVAGQPDGLKAMKVLASALEGSGIGLHLVAHSAGSVLMGHLLKALDTLKRRDLVDSCTLFAPACTLDFFDEHYRPRLAANAARTRIPTLDIYNLTNKLERDDSVAGIYRKSLLYLVSNAFERGKERPLLGMQKFTKKLELPHNVGIVYSNGKGEATRSETHGGFDNDAPTLNSTLARILRHAPEEPFKDNEVEDF
ncbi:MAG: C1 family peptidase [Pseudomonadota bacterium]